MTCVSSKFRQLAWLLPLSLLLCLFALAACGGPSNTQGASSLSNSVNTVHQSSTATQPAVQSNTAGNTTASGGGANTSVQRINQKANTLLNTLDGADNDAHSSSNSSLQDNQTQP